MKKVIIVERQFNLNCLLRNAPNKIGKFDYIKYLAGMKITRSQGIKALCYDCSNGYEKGIGCKKSLCPLFLFNPYNKKNKK